MKLWYKMLTSLILKNCLATYVDGFMYNKIIDSELLSEDEKMDLLCNNMIRLDCSVKNLTSLSDRCFPKLKSLVCNFNNISEFSTNNIDNFDNDANNVENSNVKFPVLEILDCGYNKFTKLDIQKEFPILKMLICVNNQITSLGNPNEPFFKLEMLCCSNNLLTELPNVAYPVLKSLECQNNLLTALPKFVYPQLSQMCCQGNNIIQFPSFNFNCPTIFPVLRHITYEGSLKKLPYLPTIDTVTIINNQRTTIYTTNNIKNYQSNKIKIINDIKLLFNDKSTYCSLLCRDIHNFILSYYPLDYEIINDPTWTITPC